MKKLFFTSLVLFLTSLCFAIPNMKLYEDAKFTHQISDNAIYDNDGNLIFNIQGNELYRKYEYAGAISEIDDMIIIDWYSNGEKEAHCEYSKSTGFLLLRRINWYTLEYDEKTGLKKKTSWYKDGELDSYALYEYEKDKITKVAHHKADNSLDGFLQFSYDKKTGNKTKKSHFNADNRLVRTIEYDPKTEKQAEEYEYNSDGSLKHKTLYDKNSGVPTERLVYSPTEKKLMKLAFLKFDDDGNYTLSDDFYLSSNFCFYYALKEYSEESKSAPIDWNENYSAIVRKYDFNKNAAGYSYIENLINSHRLIPFSFTLCNKNSNFYYCFAATDDDEIDLSSCYEIKLIKKAKDYRAMNKSGKGSGPFGFDIGMTYDEVKAACGGSEPEHIADNRYYVKPKKAHPLFEKYIVWISDAVGLYYIKGISRDIRTSDYGTEAKQQFDNLLSPLEKKYGKFSLTDTIKSDYHWKDEKYWMQALGDGARTYWAIWNVTKENHKDFDGLFAILLGIDSTNKYSNSEAYIWIEYEFQNHDDAQEALDDVL